MELAQKMTEVKGHKQENLSKNKTNKVTNDCIKKMFSPLVTKEM